MTTDDYHRELQDQAQRLMTQVIALGVALVVLGAVIWGVNLPGDELDSSSGSSIGIIVGALAAWAGSCFVALGVIAYGVRLGNEASRTHRV